MMPMAEAMVLLAFDLFENQNYLFFRLIASKNYHSQKYNAALDLYRHSFFILASKPETDLLVLSQDLHRISRTLRRLRDFSAALEIYSVVLELYEQQDYYTHDYISTVNQCMDTYWEQGTPDLALISLQQIEERLARNSKFPIKLRIALIQSEADQYARGNKLPKAAQTLRKAFKLHKEMAKPSIALENRLISHRSNLKKHSGDYAGALNDLSLLLERYRGSGNIHSESYLLPSVGFLQRVLGDFNASLRSYERSLELSEKITWENELERSEFEAFVINNIGIVHTALGNFPKALNAYQTSLDLSKKAKRLKNHAYALGGFGWVSFEQHDYKKAKKYYEEAIEMFSRIPWAKPPVPVLISMAETEMQLSQPNWEKRVLKLIAEAEEIAEHTSSGVDKVRAKLGRASMTARKGRIEGALHMCSDGHRLARENGFFEGKVTSQLLTARICIEALVNPQMVPTSDLIGVALNSLKKAQSYAKTAGAFPLVLEALNAESAVREAMEDFTTALAIQKHALDLAQSSGVPSSRYQTEIEKLETFQKLQSMYEVAKSRPGDTSTPMTMKDTLTYLQEAFRILRAYSASHSEVKESRNPKFSSLNGSNSL